MNEFEEGVAPTDARRRPDQRLMENGQWDEANTEKVRFIHWLVAMNEKLPETPGAWTLGQWVESFTCYRLMNPQLNPEISTGWI